MSVEAARRGPNDSPCVDLQSVRIDYALPNTGTTYTAVSDVSFTVDRGQFVCIVGPSGCGKSTLLHAIAGLTPYSDGSIAISGEQVTGPGLDRAVVFQSPALMPWVTVESNVAFGLRMSGVSKSAAMPRARDALKLVGLGDFGKRHAYQLSGGMQQRANLARALVVDPDILLMDEPFASLDAQQRDLLQLELLRIWESTDKTCVFITHQIEEAVLLGDRVVVMSKGPGSVVQLDLDIDYPRPRARQIRSEPRFAEYVETIWQCLNGGEETSA